MKPKISKGPWVAPESQLNVVYNERDWRAVAFGNTLDSLHVTVALREGETQARRNAVAIAALPEILDALIETLAEISRVNAAAGETVFNPAVTNLIVYALAKSRGEK